MRNSRLARIINTILTALAITTLSGCGYVRNCIAEGTMIATPDGQRAIETLSVGESVSTIDANRRPVLGKVTAVHRGRAKELLEFHFENGTHLRTTPEHLISTDSGWIAAGQLAIGDAIATTSNETSIASVHSVAESTRVYDLSVELYQSYFANGVLVHNKTVAVGMTPAKQSQPWTFNTPTHRYWIQLEPEPARAYRISRYRNQVEELEVLSWKLSSFWHELEIILQAQRPAKIEIDATIYGSKGAATVRDYGKIVAENVAFRPVSAELEEFELLRQAAEDAEQSPTMPYNETP